MAIGNIGNVQLMHEYFPKHSHGDSKNKLQEKTEQVGAMRSVNIKKYSTVEKKDLTVALA